MVDTPTRPESRRFNVHVSYPNFDEAGQPYFDETSVDETLVMTAEEYKNYKWQEEKGFLKIHSVKPDIPTAR